MQCTNCGAVIAGKDAGGHSCPYCNAVLPHVASAHAKAAKVQALLADRDGDGVPDAFQGLVGGGGSGGKAQTQVHVHVIGSGDGLPPEVANTLRDAMAGASGPVRAPRRSTSPWVFVLVAVAVALAVAVVVWAPR